MLVLSQPLLALRNEGRKEEREQLESEDDHPSNMRYASRALFSPWRLPERRACIIRHNAFP